MQSNSINKVGVAFLDLPQKEIRAKKKYLIQCSNDTWYQYMIIMRLWKHTMIKHTQFRCIQLNRCNYNVRKEKSCQNNDCVTNYYFMVQKKKPHKCQYSSKKRIQQVNVKQCLLNQG